jgi:Mce-associated membrane protein
MADDAVPADGKLSKSTNEPPGPTDTAKGSSETSHTPTEETSAAAAEPKTASADGETVDTGEADKLADYEEQEADKGAEEDAPRAKPRRSPARLALVLGLIIAVALAVLVGWLGYRAYRSHQAQEQRRLFVQVGRQVALDLTTISYTEAEADVHRVLDVSTGSFYGEFQKRSQPFIDIVQRAQSKSVGTITEAGLESEDGNTAQVLVAVAVKTSVAGTEEPRPRAWRMRIVVEKVGDGAKASKVEFVP